ncbi:mastermind-like protein 1 isoform X1 [Polypterus senegalus]|nr:mastermind-like protein 1 isoform X1 [Polypterus senegalus]
MMADYVVPRHSAVMERLRRRIELCRRHHNSCENRYGSTALDRLEIERQHTFALHQRCLQTKAKRASKHRQPPQPAADQVGARGTTGGGAASDLPESGTGEQSRNITLLALQETVKRKLENAASPVNGDQVGSAFGDGFTVTKKIRLESQLGSANGTSSCLPPVSPLHPLDNKVVGNDERLIHNGKPGLGLERLNGKSSTSVSDSGLGVGRDLDDTFLLKEFKQEPVDDILPCMLPSGGSMPSNLISDLNLDELEWKELIEELNRSVPDEDMQDIFNNFEDRKDTDNVTPSVPTTQDAVTIKTEFSPASVAFDQELRTDSPQARPRSSGPPLHTTNTTNTNAASPALPNSHPTQPQRQLPQNVMLPAPSSKDLSPAQQLQQLAAQKQRTQLLQNQQPPQKFHPPKWTPSASSQNPLGSSFSEKPPNTSVYQQNNGKQLLLQPNLPNKSSPKVATSSYMQNTAHPSMIGHAAASLSQSSVSSQPPRLDYRNTKPLSHYEMDHGQSTTAPTQTKSSMLAFMQEQQRRQQMANLADKQKPGLQYPPLVASHQHQDQNSAQMVPRVPGSVPGPGGGMVTQPPAPSIVSNHSSAAYLSNHQQAAVLKQQQQIQLMEHRKRLLIERHQLEKQRQQQEQQLQRHLTRPPPQYQGQPTNAYQNQVGQFPAAVNNLPPQAAGNQRMYQQAQSIIQQASVPSSVAPTSNQPDMGGHAYSNLQGVQSNMYNNMGTAVNQLHPHSAPQGPLSSGQLQRPTMGLAQSTSISAAYGQNMLSASALTAQQQQHLKAAGNQAVAKQQMTRMPSTWSHQNIQNMGNSGLAPFSGNPGFHLQAQHSKMTNQPFSPSALASNQAIPAMNSVVTGQMMPTLPQQRTSQAPPAPPQSQPQQMVTSSMNPPVTDMSGFGPAPNQSNPHCSQGFQVRANNPEVTFGYGLQNLSADGDLMDTLLKNRTTEEWMNDLDELLGAQH